MIATTEAQPLLTNYRNRITAASTRKNHTQLRNERIVKRFNELYNTERKRYDDVIDCLCNEFSLGKFTIEKAMKG